MTGSDHFGAAPCCTEILCMTILKPLTCDRTAWYYIPYKYHPEGNPHGRDIFLPDLNAHGVADWQDIRLPLGERKELGTKNKKTEDKKPESAELSLSIDNALLNETTLSTYRTNTVGLRSDGTVVAVGSSENNRSDVTGWRDIRLPVTDSDTDNDIIEAGTL